MADETFDTNLLRWIAAELYFSLGMQASREMFGKSYFSLGVDEKIAVNAAVGETVRGNYQGMTADFLVRQDPAAKNQAPKQSVGFQGSGPQNKP